MKKKFKKLILFLQYTNFNTDKRQKSAESMGCSKSEYALPQCQYHPTAHTKGKPALRIPRYLQPWHELSSQAVLGAGRERATW